jgi:cytochrome c-type protein NapC
MQDYGKSLFADNRKALSAVHYQERLVERESTCYACHTDYALFGDLKAKVNGLKHVWVHYLGTVPKKLALYQPYPNYNCLHCHDDARGYLEAEPHRAVQAQLRDGTLSCLKCHTVGHDMAAVAAGQLWQAR